jgi:hypothetical protein
MSNTSIVSINFRANLDAQNAEKCISGLQISKMFWRSMPPGKILKKGPDKISNKVVFVYYVSKVVRQTNTVPPPPPPPKQD